MEKEGFPKEQIQHFVLLKMRAIIVKDENGVCLNTMKEILTCIYEYFTQLLKDVRENSSEQTIISTGNEIPKISVKEVQMAVKYFIDKKSSSEDSFCVHLVKIAGQQFYEILSQLFHQCLVSGDIPQDWSKDIVIMVHYKGYFKNLNNYLSVSLLSLSYILFMRIIAKRIESILDFQQPVEQTGFRKGFSKTDHMHVINEIIERTNEYKRPLCLGFIYYKSTLNKYGTFSFIEALNNQGVEKEYVKIMHETYKKVEFYDNDEMKTQKPTKYQKMILQVNLNSVIENIFKLINWKNFGINVNGKYLNHLRFANSVVLIAESTTQLQIQIKDLEKASLQVGLDIIKMNTRVMLNDYCDKAIIYIDGKQIEKVKNYEYLREVINMSGNMMSKIKHRIQLGWEAFEKLGLVQGSGLPLNIKRKTYNRHVLPVMTHGCQVWRTTSKECKVLRTAQSEMERMMLGIKDHNRISDTSIRKITNVFDVIEKIKRCKWQWAGHIARRKDGRWTKDIMEWYPRDAKQSRLRPGKRPFVRWVDEIREMCGVQWMQLAQDRDEWKRIEQKFVLQWKSMD